MKNELKDFPPHTLNAYRLQSNLLVRHFQDINPPFISTQGIREYLASSSEALKPSSLDRAGIDKTMHPHQLRQSYATHLLNNGATLDVIQSLLGHENSETTRIYAQLSGKLRRELYRKYF